jgi:hypothetical protein
LLSLIPAPDEPHKFFAAGKILGSTAVLAGVGIVVYWIGKSKVARAKR